MFRNAKETIYLLLAIFLVIIIMLTTNKIGNSFVDFSSVENYEKQIDYLDIFNPDMNQPVYMIDYGPDGPDEIIREYNMKINKEMDIISRFIKKINNRAPLIVADKIAHSVVVNCIEYKIPRELVIGIMFAESFYNPYAVGPPVGSKKRRARGLGQILDERCGNEKIRKDKLHNINYNIVLIVKIIKSKLKSTNGDLDKALYYYVGKNKEYTTKVFKIMGEFRYFRSQRL